MTESRIWANASCICFDDSSAAGISCTSMDNTTMAILQPPPTGNPWDDATWVLTSAFVIFTMQSGFGLLESGTATAKNEVNIMVKNAVDVIFGGFSFYVVGYGLSFGDILPENGFINLGPPFQVAEDDHYSQGYEYTNFIFQLAFSTTTTTIVSGAMVERTRLEAYIVFSLVNTIQSSFPVHWVWDPSGFLKRLGVIDVAGGGVVHIVGGITGLVATLILRPRHRRYKMSRAPPMGSPTNVVLGMFMLWWGWLGFNCGSTQGVTGLKWALAARSAIATIISSIGGGITGIFLSYLTKGRKFELSYLVSSVLGSLVSITAMCTLCSPRLALLIGAIGGVIACCGVELLNYLHVDDPVGVVPVHLFCGIWSLIAVGLFTPEDDIGQGYELHGLFMGGGLTLLGVQLLAAVCIIVWCSIFSATVLYILSSTIGLRLPYHEELLGADMVEHSIGDRVYDKVRGRLVDPPKWKQRLETRGIVKSRRISIIEAEQITECTSATTSYPERSRSNHRRRFPSFKILASPRRKIRRAKKRTTKMTTCQTQIDGGCTGDGYATDHNGSPGFSEGTTYSRRGARRIRQDHNMPRKWTEVLGVREDWFDLNDSMVSEGRRNLDQRYHTRVLREQATQTVRTIPVSMRPSLTNRKTLDPHIWNSLYEHMV